MVEAIKVHYEKLQGDYLGEVMAVEVTPNHYYKPEEPNSTRDVLTIKFRFQKPDTMKWVEKEQKFIAPLIGGKGLFTQMCELIRMVDPNTMEDGDIKGVDEQQLVGLIAVFTIGERKGKDGKFYEEVKGCRSRDEVAPPAQATANTPEDFLPFD